MMVSMLKVPSSTNLSSSGKNKSKPLMPGSQSGKGASFASEYEVGGVSRLCL